MQTAEPLTVYAIHLRSGDSAADMQTRQLEAMEIRRDADLLGDGTAIVYAGDFNLLGTQEPAWAELTKEGSGRAIDPVDMPGRWRDGREFVTVHTQDPGSRMDDRFDLQLVSGELLDGAGLEYVQGSYRVVGNDGSHQLGRPIATETGAPPGVLAALVAASDHLPVLASYEWGFRPGDADGDGDFDTSDLVHVLQVDKYLSGLPAAWAHGDLVSDGVFNQYDIVAALPRYNLPAGITQWRRCRNRRRFCW